MCGEGLGVDGVGGVARDLERHREGRRTAVVVKLERKKGKCCQLSLSLTLSHSLSLWGCVCVVVEFLKFYFS